MLTYVDGDGGGGGDGGDGGDGGYGGGGGGGGGVSCGGGREKSHNIHY